ncbi:MAG: hypothetical protein HOW73_39970 [Polyangiaceae bacterium]|nr:hypothetical protein [Polyangiaceae bacterium]
MNEEPGSFLPPPRRTYETAGTGPLPSQPVPAPAAEAAPAPRRRAFLAFAPLAIVVLVGLGMYFSRNTPSFIRPLLPSGRAASRMTPHLGELVAQPNRVDLVGGPKVCGKVVSIDTAGPAVDPSFHELDAAVRASNPAEVGTVARVTCADAPILRGGNTTPRGSFVRCRVELVERASKKWLGGLTIDSEDLPAPLMRSDDDRGSRPSKAIARWISSLPPSCS